MFMNNMGGGFRATTADLRRSPKTASDQHFV